MVRTYNGLEWDNRVARLEFVDHESSDFYEINNEPKNYTVYVVIT